MHPGFFSPRRKAFLESQRVYYDAAYEMGDAKNCMAHIFSRYCRRFPLSLPEDIEPTEEELMAVRDDEVVEEGEPETDVSNLTLAERLEETARREAKHLAIKKLKARIQCWLNYRYIRDHAVVTTKEASLKDNPFANVFKLVNGLAEKKPCKRSAINVWSRGHSRAIEEQAHANILSSQGSLSRGLVGMRARVKKDMFDALDVEDCEHYEFLSKEEHTGMIAQWVEDQKQSAPSTTPEARQHCIDQLNCVVQPLLEAICDATGWKASLIAGGPEQVCEGQLGIKMIHCGTTSGNHKMDFGRAEHERLPTLLYPMWVDFLKNCYSVKECQSRALHQRDATSEPLAPQSPPTLPLRPISPFRSPSPFGSPLPPELGYMGSPSPAPSRASTPPPPVHSPSAVQSRASTPFSIRPAPGSPSPVPPPVRAPSLVPQPASPSSLVAACTPPIISSPPRSPSGVQSRLHPPPLSQPAQPQPISPPAQPQPISPPLQPQPVSPPAHVSLPAQPQSLSPPPQPQPVSLPQPPPVSPPAHVSPPPQPQSLSPPPQPQPVSLPQPPPVSPPPQPPSAPCPPNADLGGHGTVRPTAAQEVIARHLRPATLETRATRKRVQEDHEGDTQKKHRRVAGSPAQPVATATPASAHPTSINPRPAAASAKWFDDALNLFLKGDSASGAGTDAKLGAHWVGLMESYSNFQREHGFSDDKRLPKKGRPTFVNEWIGDMEMEFKLWWTAIQPGWRVEGGAIVKDRVVGDWGSLLLPGVNGLLSVVAGLFFWGLEVGNNKARQREWLAALEDCRAVFKAMCA